MLLFYDDHCIYCLRFARWISRHDVWKRIEILPLHTTLAHTSSYPFDKVRAEKEIASVVNGRVRYGLASLMRVAWRVPMLWILLPLLWLTYWSGLGTYAYRYFAARRKICTDRSCPRV